MPTRTLRSIVATTATLCLAAACGGGQSGSTEPTSPELARAPEPTAEAKPTEPGATSDVEPIPEGMHSLTPHLVVPDIEKAVAFYDEAFGAEQRELVAGPDGEPMHAEITLGDSVVMLSPQNEQWDTKAPEAAGGTCGGLMVYVEDADTSFERALEAGAKKIMATQDMFWGDRYGQVEDPYGHRWSLATHQYDVSDEEMQKRAKAWSEAMTAGEEPPTFEGGEEADSYKAEGFFTVTPSLVVTGPDAVDFYEKAFGAERRTVMTMPNGKLMHGELEIGDSILMVTGEHPEHDEHMRAPKNLEGAPFSLMLYVEDADAVFERATDAGAETGAPVKEMFWGDRYGEAVGPSGHHWGLATRVADLTDEEIEQRMREHMSQHHPEGGAPDSAGGDEGEGQAATEPEKPE